MDPAPTDSPAAPDSPGAGAEPGAVGWGALPQDVLLHVFRRLQAPEALAAAKSCRWWYEVFKTPALWRHLEFNLSRGEADAKQLLILEHCGACASTVVIRVDQSEKENRDVALRLLGELSRLPDEAQLRGLRVEFTGTNPLFYAGQEFVAALTVLFGGSAGIERLDVSALPVMFSDEMLTTLADRHRRLRFLDIQNKQLVCKITCLKHVVERCRFLVDLRVFNASMTEEVLVELGGKDRAPLLHLSLLCRRQEKFSQSDLSEAAWGRLVESSPDLAVTLKFDHTCPLWKVRQMMKPTIPVVNLFLETYTMVYEELEVAIESYAPTVRKVVIQSQPSEELDVALIQLARRCERLESLHVMCTLYQETIDEVLRLQPRLRSFTLKNAVEPHPWVADEVLDEIHDRCK